jgi:hypothetical protein
MSNIGLLLRSKQRKEDDISDGGRIGEDHDPTIDTNSFPGCWRHPEFEGPKKIFIETKEKVSLLAFFPQLLEESLPLLNGVVQFRETISDLPAGDEEFEPIDDI